MYVLIALLALLLALPASAQVQINVGINLAAPPPMVEVSEVQSVQYVPTASANLFYYGGQYWVFQDGAWYYAGGYNGPWVVATAEYVPQPLLIVPVTYYRRPPPAWRDWHHDQPPQWGNNYGRSWSGKREVFVAHSQPVHEQPAHAQPVQQQAHPAPVHEQPAHAQPVQQQAHPAPVHEQPAHAQPVQQQAHPAPVHEQPAHAQPVQQQAHPAPVHEQPAHEQPAHAQPAAPQAKPPAAAEKQPEEGHH
jgi:hypothetical protein